MLIFAGLAALAGLWFVLSILLWVFSPGGYYYRRDFVDSMILSAKAIGVISGVGLCLFLAFFAFILLATGIGMLFS